MRKSSKDSLKQAIGTPRWWLINGVAIVLFLALVVAVWPDDADGATSPPTNAVASDHMVGATSAGAMLARPAWEHRYAKRKVRQFKRGVLGNAKGYKLPKPDS